jgi:MoaA/NifB/PqqE/SkfB family radical SAM enzyme
MLALIDKHRPLHVSIVGGEPLVRYKELHEILPRLAAKGIYTQLVTSAVRQIPLEWARLPRFQLVVSIDGLQPEHDARRKPATYERILRHIAGHQITVHCTVTRQQVRRDGYLDEFVRFWSANAAVAQLWISLYTPQLGELSAERLTKSDRERVIGELMRLRTQYPKLRMPKGMIESYVTPPHSPKECIFALTTACVSADFQKPITPCQFGGNPDCANCGCIASAALAAVGRHRLPGAIRVGAIFEHSYQVGTHVKRVREAINQRRS